MNPAEQVLVLMASNERQLSEREWDYLACPLPPYLRQKALQFHRWEDRQASLFGKLLLLKGLGLLQEDPHLIRTIQWDEYQRPFMAGSIDFNIAHAGEVVVCALLKSGRIGIDVEAIKPIDIPDYKSVFTEKEYELIVNSTHPLSSFYNFWTRKEALIKADGRGFYLDPKTFDAIPDSVNIDDRQWQIEKLATPENHVCHLALPAEKRITIQLFAIEELLD